MLMGYVSVVIVCLMGATKGACAKKMSYQIQSVRDSLFFNCVRMIICCLIAFAFVAAEGQLSSLPFDRVTLLTSLAAGAATALMLVSWVLGVKNGAYVMMDTFANLSAVIPIVGCALLYNEVIMLSDGIGYLVLLAGVFIMSGYNKSVKGSMRLSTFVCLMLNLLTTGTYALMQKIYINNISQPMPAAFNLYVTVFSTLILLGVYLAGIYKDERGTLAVRADKFKKVWLVVVAAATAQYLYTYFITKASVLDASIVYPIQNGLQLVFASMIGWMFGEKPTSRAALGIIILIAGLVIMNTLAF